MSLHQLRISCTQETAELELERERHKMGYAQTVQELQSMIAALEREAENNRGSSSKRQALLSDTETAKADLRAAVAKLEVCPFTCLVSNNLSLVQSLAGSIYCSLRGCIAQ